MFDFLDDIVDSVCDTVTDFVEDPIGETIHHVTAPIRNGMDIIDGLSEGELRTQAILALGLDIASGMATSELIEWYEER